MSVKKLQGNRALTFFSVQEEARDEMTDFMLIAETDGHGGGEKDDGSYQI